MTTFPPLELRSHCIASLFVSDVPFFALADGTIHCWDDSHRVTHAHSGLLAAVLTFDRAAVLTGGEDGRICRIEQSGDLVELANVPRKWMTAVASGPAGAFAFASGRTVWLDDGTGVMREFQQPSAIEDIAFAPDGSSLAVARYNGVSIHSLVTERGPVELQWNGMHTGLIFSPDGRFLLATMRENVMHGWRLRDAQHMRMIGYPARIGDWSWSADGKWLATSGAPTAIVWPFEGRYGPIGQTPLELGVARDGLVTSVACHPLEDMAAIGYADGTIVAARIDKERETMLRRSGQGEVTSLAWDSAGTRLAFGSERGECGVIDMRT